MKQFIFSLLFLFAISFTSYSQDNEGIYTNVDEAAEFPGGEEAWEKFLMKHVDYDMPIFNDAPRGIYKIKIRFAILKDGKVSHLKALTRHGYGMEGELIRVIKKSKGWLPAKVDGQPVNSFKELVFTFDVEIL